jgi:autotransporter-associated beta strand protein
MTKQNPTTQRIQRDIRRFCRSIRKKLLTGIMLGLVAAAARGQQFWRTDGTSGTWTGANWGSSALGPFSTSYVANSDAQFTANSTVTFATASIGNVTVAANQTVTITAAGTATFGASGSGGLVRTFDIGSGATLTWQSQTMTANSTAGLTKSSPGTLDLGALTYSTTMSGGFTLNDGTLIVSGNKALGSGSLTLNGGTVQSSGTRAFAATSIVLGGNFAFSGTGNANWDTATTIALGAATRTITNSTTSGSRQLRGLIAGNSGSGLNFTGTGAAQIYIGNAGNTFDGPIAITGGEVVFNDNGSFGASTSITLDGGRLTMATMDTSGNTSALTAATMASSRNLFVGPTAGTSISIQGSTGVTTYNGVIADKPSTAGILVKQGAGKLILGGASIYSGDTFVNNGTVQLSADDRLPSTTTVNIGQSASANVGRLDLNGANQHVAGLNSVVGVNTVATAKNAITNSAGACTLTLQGGGSYSYGDGSTNNSGIISGPFSLVKAGSGTQILGDTNAYTGTTTVSNGTLVINGSIAPAGTTVAGGTLAGNGTVFGAVSVSGALSPGYGAVGKLTLGPVLLQSGGAEVVKVVDGGGAAGTGYDTVVAMGDVGVLSTSGTPFIVRLASSNAVFNNANKYVWNIISSSGAVTNFAANRFQIDSSAFTNNLGGGGFFIATNGAGLNVVFEHPPVAAPVTFSRTAGTMLKIAISDLKTNWSDADGDTVTLSSVAGTSANNVAVSKDSSYIYYNGSDNQPDTFTYVVGDGFTTTSGTVTISVSAPAPGAVAQISYNGGPAPTITFAGIPGRTNVVQASTNLIDWVNISTNVAGSNGLWQVTDNDATNYPQRYYRSYQPYP